MLFLLDQTDTYMNGNFPTLVYQVKYLTTQDSTCTSAVLATNLHPVKVASRP